MFLPLSYSVRVLWMRRTSALATTSAVTLVVLVLASSQMLANGLSGTLGVSGTPDRALVLQQAAVAEVSSRMPQGVQRLAEAAPGVRKGPDGAPLVTGESIAAVLLPRVDDPSKIASVFVRGVTASSLQMRPTLRVVKGRAPSSAADEAMIGTKLADRYRGLTLGGTFELKSGREIQIVGVFEANGTSYESEVWADLEAVRSSLGWEGYVSSVTVQLESPGSFSDFAHDLKLVTNGEATAERESEYYQRISKGLATLFVGLGGLVALIFSLGAMLGAAITMYSSVSQRAQEIGIFRALGFKRRDVLRSVLLEATALSSLGALLGLLVALSISRLELSTMNGLSGAEITFRFVPSAAILLGSLVVGMAIGLLGGVFPALRAARTSPLLSMRV